MHSNAWPVERAMICSIAAVGCPAIHFLRCGMRVGYCWCVASLKEMQHLVDRLWCSRRVWEQDTHLRLSGTCGGDGAKIFSLAMCAKV